MIYPSFDNTSIVVVTYNPNPSDFTRNIKRFLSIASSVIVVDNNSNFDIYSLVKDYIHVYLIKSKENKGIAWALNKGINKALTLNAKFVLSFDQDSYPINNILKLYAKYIIDNNINSAVLLGTSYCENAQEVDNTAFKEALTIITSGCLHSKNVFEKIGLYDESLFIDSVDFDYSLKAHNAGILTMKSTIPMISHHLGNPLIKYRVKSTNHSIIRRYYMSRNNIILSQRYFFSNPLWIIKKNFFFCIDLLKLLIVESNRSKKFKSIYKGFIDGFKHT